VNPGPTNQPASPSAEAAEPKAGQVAVPVWLIILFFLILYLGMVYFDRSSGWFNERVYAPYGSIQQVEAFQPVTGAPGLAQLGLQVYNKPTCVACHQTNGKGLPGQFPPLVQSDWVLEPEPGRIIRIVLDGLSGPMKVNGQTFNGAMVPWKDALTDEEIAAVLTYVRQNPEWGNKAPEVKPERVKAVRDKTKSRKQPYSQEELEKVAPGD
jgi:mono/diheme cytochrome c family protein